MRNAHLWAPSKFVQDGDRFRFSDDPTQLGIGSRHTTSLKLETMVELIQEHARGELVDVGCGRAPYYGVYRDQANRVICIDWPNSYHFNAHTDVYCDLTAPLPFPSQRFDTLLVSEVFEHIPNPESLWRECARLLKPGGQMIISIPFLYPIHEEPHDYYRYTEFALRRFCGLAGLELLKLQPVGGMVDVLVDQFIKLIMISRLRFIAPGLGRLMHRLASIGWVRSFSQRTASRGPLAYALVARKPIPPAAP